MNSTYIILAQRLAGLLFILTEYYNEGYFNRLEMPGL